jgi:hypothetical protein
LPSGLIAASEYLGNLEPQQSLIETMSVFATNDKHEKYRLRLRRPAYSPMKDAYGVPIQSGEARQENEILACKR